MNRNQGILLQNFSKIPLTIILIKLFPVIFSIYSQFSNPSIFSPSSLLIPFSYRYRHFHITTKIILITSQSKMRHQLILHHNINQKQFATPNTMSRNRHSKESHSETQTNAGSNKAQTITKVNNHRDVLKINNTSLPVSESESHWENKSSAI